MTFAIELSDEDVKALEAQAEAQGLSAEQYVQQILQRELAVQAKPPVSARIREIWAGMPDDVRAKLPNDGASQIDYYIYGLPKREP